MNYEKKINLRMEELLDNNINKCKLSIINNKELIDYIIDRDLKIEIADNSYKYSKYIRDDFYRCPRCCQKVQKSMIKINRGCPICGFNESFSVSNMKFLSIDEFNMIINPLYDCKDLIKTIEEKILKFNNGVAYDEQLILNIVDKDNILIEGKSECVCKHIVYLNFFSQEYKLGNEFKTDQHSFLVNILKENGWKVY